MCGFAGMVHRDPAFRFDEARLVRMRDSITHRGPDDAGHYLAPGIALGSRRLAILDLSPRGHMPMSTPDGRFHIVYNGEVYNYRDLRAPLEARGHAFRSNTDTEVLLALYATEGPAMLDRLNGMFAFAIWDARERSLFLTRDRLGVKPLYYAEHEGAFYFGSEEKALFAGGVPAEFDPATWQELLCFRYVAGENTPFRGVRRLLPGHHLLWKDGRFQIRRWWHLGERARALADGRTADAVNWFGGLFDDAVNLRRISDVPVGVMLSGGLDSSSVAASLAKQAGSGVESFTMRFAEAKYDEGELARQVADQWKLQFHPLTVPDEELLPRLRAAAWLNDEPLAHASDLYVGAISQFAKQRVTVLLSGEGADEFLGGYVRYRPLRHPRLLGLARPFLPVATALGRSQGRLRKLSRFLQLGTLDRFILFNACNVLPEDLAALGLEPQARFDYREQALAEAKQFRPDDPMRQAMYSDQHTFLCSLLDRNDRMTMGASIECRVPFLDFRLVEGLSALPTPALLGGRESKHLLRASVGGRLPHDVLHGRKWGFGVPWGAQFRRVPALREWVAALPGQPVFRDGPIAPKVVGRVIDEFLAGADASEALAVQFVMIALWHEAYFPRVAALQKAVTA